MKRARSSAGLLYALHSILYTLLLGCHSIAAPTPISQLNAQQLRGRGVFLARCSQCHYDRSEDSLHGPGLAGIFQKPYLHSGAPANDERVSATVLHGRNLMPAVSGLDADDLNDLLAYLHSL